MPNWCCNRIYFKKSDRLQTADDLKALLDSTGWTRTYAEALHVLRRAFLLVHSGHIRVDAELYGLPPLVWQTEAGGCLIDLNATVNPVVSRLIRMLIDGESTTELLERVVNLGLTAELHKYPNQDDYNDICWQHATKVFHTVLYDYAGTFPKSLILADYLQPQTYGTELKAEPNDLLHHMGSVVPVALLPAINGYNGVLDKDTQSGYDQCVDEYGTKWAVLDMRVWLDKEHVYVDFDTAWTNPSEQYYDRLSDRIPEFDTLHYAEQGVGFCGDGVAITPGCVAFRESSLDIIRGEDDEPVSVSPEWIVGKVDHYGG